MPFWNQEETFYENLLDPKTQFESNQISFAKNHCFFYKSLGVTAHVNHFISGKEISLSTIGANLNYITCQLKRHIVASKERDNLLLNRVNSSEVFDDYLNLLSSRVSEIH